MKDVWYVGTDGKAAGEIQGKLLKELWDKQKQSVDRNQNGKLDYILIEGEESHYDTIRRTNGFLESGRELPLKQLGNLTADWKQEVPWKDFLKLDGKVGIRRQSYATMMTWHLGSMIIIKNIR